MDTRETTLEISRPKRVRHSYRQTIEGTPDEVFPLLCPVRELDWVEGWSPDWVISDSGLAEPDCVFQTPGEPAPATWVITRHQPADRVVEMIKFTPGHTVCRLEIGLEACGGQRTHLTVAYQYTSLGPPGDVFLEGFTEDSYLQMMRGWEAAMNRYLAAA